MRRNLKYLSYVLRHKWFVLVASLRIGAPIWNALVHDLSKFRPSEWCAYAQTFYKPDGSKQYAPTLAFDQAWNAHQNRNPHHWQYWLLHRDNGSVEALPIPMWYVLEMVADWMGAGRAITGKWGAAEWYRKNCDKMQLHPETRMCVEILLGLPPTA